MGKALSGELSCPCDRSCYGIMLFCKFQYANRIPSITQKHSEIFFFFLQILVQIKSIIRGCAEMKNSLAESVAIIKSYMPLTYCPSQA